MRTAIKDITTLQATFDQMIQSGSPVDCSKAYGGVQPVERGELNWGMNHLRISSGMTVLGESSASTRITYLGGPNDPPAIEIYSYTGTDNRYVDMPEIRGLQINCPNGARAIGVDASKNFGVGTLEHLTVCDVVTNSGIDLPIEQYATLLDDVRCAYVRIEGGVKNPLGGGVNVVRRLKVHGKMTNPNLRARFNVRGALSIEGFSWFEDVSIAKPTIDDVSLPMFRFEDWTDRQGNKHRGNVAVAGLMHDEAHLDRLWGVVSGADFHAVTVAGTEKWPWLVERGGAMYLQRHAHNADTITSPDGTGKLFVGGEQAWGPSN